MADIKTLLKGVQENISLAPHTSFKIGGPARYFYIAKTSDDIKQAIKFAKELKLAYHILGNGSNILVSDNGFDGLVIQIKNQESRIKNQEIFAESGVSLSKLVKNSVEAGLTGLEWLIGIPGTVGGAIYGNAGAFGHTIEESIESVKVFNYDNLTEENFLVKECGFTYRGSLFKEKKYIILSAVFKLKIGSKKESECLLQDYLAIRNKNQPVGAFSAGSFFKNPLVSEKQKAFERLIKKCSEAKRFCSNGKIPVGWLIEKCGLKGKKIGGAMVSKKHGNMIINTGNAKATDIIILAGLIKQKIRVKFSIQLEEEIQYVGF